MRPKNKHRYDQIYAVALLGIAFLVVLLLTQDQSLAYWLQYWWMAPIAFVIAITVNTVGISEAALLVPFLVIVFPLLAGESLTALQSVQAGLITESFGLTSSALAFLAYKLVDKRLALYSILVGIPFVAVGAFFSTLLPESVLLSLVAATLIVSIFMMRYAKTLKKHRMKQHEMAHVDLSVHEGHRRVIRSLDHRVYRYCLTKKGYEKRALGFSIGGLFQGAAGFGIGEMGIIGMLITKIPVRVAIGTSHLIIAVTAILAASIHIFQAASHATVIPWNIPFVAVPAVIIGGQLSPYVAAKLPTKQLERFISALFFVIATALFVLVFKNGF